MRMSLLLAVIFTGVVQLGGLALIVWFLTKSLEQQNKTVQMLAMFKKASEVAEVGAMIDLTENIGKPSKIEVVAEEQFYPHEMSNDTLAAVRAQM